MPLVIPRERGFGRRQIGDVGIEGWLHHRQVEDYRLGSWVVRASTASGSAGAMVRASVMGDAAASPAGNTASSSCACNSPLDALTGLTRL